MNSAITQAQAAHYPKMSVLKNLANVVFAVRHKLYEPYKLHFDLHLGFTSNSEGEEQPHVQVTQHLSKVVLYVHRNIR